MTDQTLTKLSLTLTIDMDVTHDGSISTEDMVTAAREAFNDGIELHTSPDLHVITTDTSEPLHYFSMTQTKTPEGGGA